VEISKESKKIVLVAIFIIFVLGLAISGPKFFYKVQMAFGFKGKIDMIEHCLETKGCAITTDELEFYENYAKVRKSKISQKLRDTDFGQALEKKQ